MSGEQGNGELAWGVCKWFDERKGYGWITLPGGECDVFIHAKELRDSGIHRPLETGERIGCLLKSRNRGWYAVNITVRGDET